ncbi:hypothetical protein HX017_01395 [Myroides marinus]|uniref:lectin-like domain-containing protein n=1 Tax=Myroides marinus TaxID=703342 RepID=UPI002577B4AA|nr:hypothetical protein [Myroides marinus]MDM1345778.1 hypothetical protein [Myroides marinus]MDM1349361.1 hypothetical protein [Myroides marinus]MDM1352961.1 hypothetical protein [Myroides marinus]MDM1356571.1 hypothetical protein [Myroides marinus]MDM1360931.1 hypothetical protein [Myroides marinus]
MKNRFWIYDKFHYCFLLLLLVNQLSFGQNIFPYFNTGQTKDGFKILGESTNDISTPGLITFTPDGIKLVDNLKQYAGVSLDNLDFTTEKGFILEFEFGMDLGSAAPRYGDGIAMVLYDAAETNPSMGVKGGALGYAHIRDNSAAKGKPGFSRGFLGLGLDLYGNYKNIMTSSDEIRNGIINDDQKGDYVVLRGPYNKTETLEGYPVLFAVNTYENLNYYLNRGSGSVEKRQKGFEGQRFNIRSGKANVGIGDPGYRKIMISLVPGKDNVSNEDGFFISVDVFHGNFKSIVVKNYFIPKTGSITYKEQLTTGGATSRDMQISVPKNLKMAFTGSTGGASIRAYIRNIALSLPFSPVANDMSIQGVLVDIPTVVKPLYSAYGYNSNVYSILNPPIKSVLYLDKKAFRFKRMDPNSKQLVLTPEPYILDEPTVGKFVYNENTGEVTFTPIANFKGDVPYTFYYDIKNVKPATGTDISIEEYRSRTAAVTLNFVKKGTGIDAYPTIIVNRGIKNTKQIKP